MIGTVPQACVRLSRIPACRAFQTSSLLHRSPSYPGHIPLNRFENTFLTVGAALMAFMDTRRGDMVAALGETTACATLPRLRDAMLDSPEGRKILKDRPRISSKTLDLQKLREFPDGTFGREYTRWLEVCNITPDSREPVHYIGDPELAYVMQRYRETHDFYHALFGLRVSALPELALKAFEFANLGFPMTALALGASIKMKKAQRDRLWHEFVPWGIKCGGNAQCLLTVYWEERWDQKVQALKNELGIWDPPVSMKLEQILTPQRNLSSSLFG